ncbi:MAG: hypothetical protein RSD77_06700 [Romboutsia sp.]
MYYHTVLTMRDGSKIDGIIENVGTDRIMVLVGEDVIVDEDCENQFDRQSSSRRPRRFRRFRRRIFPLSALLAISLLAHPF